MTSINDQVYQDKLKELDNEMDEIIHLSHPDIVKGIAQLKRQLVERLEINDIVMASRKERVEHEYERGLQAAAREREEKRAELVDSLLAELDEKRKQIEHDHQNTDLHGDSMEMKPMTKRNLRRRPNEPTPTSEKRPPKSSPQLNFRLSDAEINEDLLALGSTSAAAATTSVPQTTAVTTTTAASGSSSPARSACGSNERAVISAGDTEAMMDGYRLTYDGKHYLRGQSVTIEASDVGRICATIQSIGNNEMSLKSVGDHKRLTVSLADLQLGKVLVKKRSA